ncbi:MAG: STELLO glycosyltransferase family protein [Ginsengibacter sp.]
MKKSIVITSIFLPTQAVVSFSGMEDYTVIVVGDKKTPSNWLHQNVQYISVADQEKMGFDLVHVLPFNHYCRKMLGYLKAIDDGADCIIDTDDDNIPKDNWCFPEFESEFECTRENEGFINVYQLFTEKKIWPRGLPLNLISKDFQLNDHIESSAIRVGIWQGLADEDPDVDAIYRLTDDTPCYFNKRNPVVLKQGTFSPFNTQNTMIRKELFALLYLPCYVTFRFTDILRGWVAQPIMSLYGYHLGFTGATVVQKRNPHDYMKDFISEIPMYEQGEKVINLVLKSISASKTIEDNLYNAYKSLLKEGIVCEKEMITLESWLKDFKKIRQS